MWLKPTSIQHVVHRRQGSVGAFVHVSAVACSVGHSRSNSRHPVVMELTGASLRNGTAMFEVRSTCFATLQIPHRCAPSCRRHHAALMRHTKLLKLAHWYCQWRWVSKKGAFLQHKLHAWPGILRLLSALHARHAWYVLACLRSTLGTLHSTAYSTG